MSYKLGLASEERMELVSRRKDEVKDIIQKVNTTTLTPAEVNGYLQQIESAPIVEKQKLSKIVLRPDVSLSAVVESISRLSENFSGYSADSLQQSEIQIKYERYIEKEEQLVAKLNELENLVIPDVFDYDNVSALSNEALQKFKKIRPRTIGQASRISGVNPSDIQILMVYIGR
jgi:tRNA uridine 5-carboxymethylaminomethyl modification enzyme